MTTFKESGLTIRPSWRAPIGFKPASTAVSLFARKAIDISLRHASASVDCQTMVQYTTTEQAAYCNRIAVRNGVVFC